MSSFEIYSSIQDFDELQISWVLQLGMTKIVPTLILVRYLVIC